MKRRKQQENKEDINASKRYVRYALHKAVRYSCAKEMSKSNDVSNSNKIISDCKDSN